MSDDRGLHAWMDDAACKGQPLQVFFYESHESNIDLPGVAICNTCPVRAECLNFAVQNDVQHGVFGGLTAYQRRTITIPTQPNRKETR